MKANMKANHAPTSTDIRAIIVARRDEETNDRALADKAREVIATFQGKQIGKRLKDKLATAFGDALIHLQKESYGAWTVYAWSGNTGRSYEKRLMFFIPSTERCEREGWKTLREGFEKSNPSFYAGTDERQALREIALRVYPNTWSVCDDMANSIVVYQIARKQNKKMFYYKQPLSPDEFALKEAFDLRDGI